LALLLLVVWIYLGLMCREFFMRDWLKARPIAYLWSHMLIMPLIDLYATACDWLPAGAGLPSGLYWFLIVSFFNGVVIEIGRKIRAPEDEELGVETYSALWGRRNAVLAWLGALALTGASAFMAAHRIAFILPVSILLGLLLTTAGVIAWRFLQRPISSRAGLFELASGVWTLVMYVSLGAVPLLWRV
jgi:4-hydroxybenzoate polyprenyltransferase